MPMSMLRSAVLASVVGTVLLAAEVSGGQMTTHKFYDTAGCKDENMRNSVMIEATGTCMIAPSANSYKRSCTSGKYSEVHYNDSSCTTEDASKQKIESGKCEGGSNYYEYYTDCVDTPSVLVSHGRSAEYKKAGCAAADKVDESTFDVGPCTRSDEFNSSAWVVTSVSRVLSADKKKFTVHSYGTSDCTGSFSDLAEVWTCDACMLVPGMTDEWLVVTYPGCGASALAGAAPPSASRLAPLVAAFAAVATAAVVVVQPGA